MVGVNIVIHVGLIISIYAMWMLLIAAVIQTRGG